MWLCSCGCINLSANRYCPASLTKKFYSGKHEQISPSTYDYSLYLVAEGRVRELLMTPNEELHAQFFSEEAVLVVSMDDVDLEEHIQELEKIAREAKARIMAATEEKRNRKAKAGVKAWKVEPIGPDPTVTDSLNKVKQRSGRMGKLEGMRNKLAVLGIPDSEIDQMLAKMVAKARKEPEALRAETKLKNELGTKETPLITEEERLQRAEARRKLDEQDKAEEKAKKEQAKALFEAMQEQAKNKDEAPVHSSKDEKLILTEDEPAKDKPTPPSAADLFKAMQDAAKTQAQKKESTS